MSGRPDIYPVLASKDFLFDATSALGQSLITYHLEQISVGVDLLLRVDNPTSP